MNPFLAETAHPAGVPACNRCDDFGWIIASHDWTVRNVFENGTACTCAAGTEYAAMVAEWHKGLGQMKDAPAHIAKASNRPAVASVLTPGKAQAKRMLEALCQREEQAR